MGLKGFSGKSRSNLFKRWINRLKSEINQCKMVKNKNDSPNQSLEEGENICE